jgi:hypothetical protein
MFYCVDTKTGKRHSLHTCIEDEARQIVDAKNQALRQPAINLQIAQAYLQHGDPAMAARTWQHVMEQIHSTKTGNTRLFSIALALGRLADGCCDASCRRC